MKFITILLAIFYLASMILSRRFRRSDGKTCKDTKSCGYGFVCEKQTRDRESKCYRTIGLHCDSKTDFCAKGLVCIVNFKIQNGRAGGDCQEQ